ncbi:hypothetical protein [Haliangium sp.]|uniref:hypothetical protein n=1 Tax=Haliangium sp. TaxID=2663208 RepID=UPI003D0B2949
MRSMSAWVLCALVGAWAGCLPPPAHTAAPPTGPRLELEAYSINGLATHIHSPTSDPIQIRNGVGGRVGGSWGGLIAGGVVEGTQTEAKLTHLIGEITHELVAGGYLGWQRWGHFDGNGRWGGAALVGAGVSWLGFADDGFVDFWLIDSGVLPFVDGELRLIRQRRYRRFLVRASAGVVARSHLRSFAIDDPEHGTTTVGGRSVSVLFSIGLGI